MVRVRAPELPQHYPWLNCERPLSLKALRGRVVLLDFWTYCCINCLHVLSDLKALEQKYQDDLIVIGVHSAKFDNEKDIENIRQAILRYDIDHPVLVDNSFQIWQQYTVRAWPTLVLIDPQGYVAAAVAGEGHRQTLDQLIGDMVQAYPDKAASSQNFSIGLEKQQQPIVSPLAFPGKVLADAPTDTLFIADTGHHRIVVTSLSGELKQVIGTGQIGLTDGSFASAQFAAPQGMALDRERQLLYVADTDNHAIRQIDLEQQTVITIAGTGQQSRTLRPHGGRALEVDLNSPWDLEKLGKYLFIAIAGSHQIWVMNLQRQTLSTYAGTGAEACVDGAAQEAAFAQPSGIVTDGEELFVADSEGSTIRAIGLGEMPSVRTVCGSGELFGFGDADGWGTAARLQHCLGVEYVESAEDAYLWIADTYNHKIKRVNPQTGRCETLLGNGIPALHSGRGQAASFYEPSGLSAAGQFLYVADTNNHVIRRVVLETLDAEVLTIPGLCAPNLCFPAALAD